MALKGVWCRWMKEICKWLFWFAWISKEIHLLNFHSFKLLILTSLLCARMWLPVSDGYNRLWELVYRMWPGHRLQLWSICLCVSYSTEWILCVNAFSDFLSISPVVQNPLSKVRLLDWLTEFCGSGWYLLVGLSPTTCQDWTITNPKDTIPPVDLQIVPITFWWNWTPFHNGVTYPTVYIYSAPNKESTFCFLAPTCV